MIRTLHEAIGAVESYSPAEEQFNRRRRTAGLVLAPIVLVGLLCLPSGSLSPQAHRLAAIVAMVVVLWISEALPMAVTAVLGPMLAVILGVAPAQRALAPFADPIIFLFIGSFMLAESMFVHGVDRRLAFSALSSRLVGGSAPRILITYAAVATAISMWISNTATTAMMFPIGLSIVSHLWREGSTDEQPLRRFSIAMMLMTSFASSIGGMATPVGTPPNLIGVGMIERITRVHLDFFRWMLLGVPIVLTLFAFLAALFYWTSVRGLRVGESSAALVQDELKKLGPMSVGQRNVLIAFGVTVVLWILPGPLTFLGFGRSAFVTWYQAAVPEGVAAMLGAVLLFVLPVSWRKRRFTLTWEQATRIDWGTVLLYGGGLALGDLAFQTGLADWTGRALGAWLPLHSTLTTCALFAGLAIVLSEATSNTAAAIMIVPIALAASGPAGVNPILPALAATLGSSMGFMMPISTASNAIVYSSGYVPLTQMTRYGLLLDIVGFIVIVSFVTLLGPLIWP